MSSCLHAPVVGSVVTTVNALGRGELPQLVRIPGGAFIMGQDPIFESEAPNPPHEVMLSPYWMGVHPVTNAEYRVFVEATGAQAAACEEHPIYGAGDRPVVGVSWHDALRYCHWAGGDLPTEAQWEFAARGPDGRRFPWGDGPPDDRLACFAQDWNRSGPGRIGEHPDGVSPFGCHDMAGSVWEWCVDMFVADAHVERGRVARDPRITGSGRVRPLRGGCWRSIE